MYVLDVIELIICLFLKTFFDILKKIYVLINSSTFIFTLKMYILSPVVQPETLSPLKADL